MVITAFFGALTLLGCQKLESTVRINSPIVSILVHLLLLTIGVFIFKSTDFCCIIASFLFKTGFIKSSAHHKDLSLDYIDYTILVLQTVSHILYYLYIELKSKHQNKGGCPHSRHSTEASERSLKSYYEIESLASLSCCIILKKFYDLKVSRVPYYVMLGLYLGHLLLLVKAFVILEIKEIDENPDESVEGRAVDYLLELYPILKALKGLLLIVQCLLLANPVEFVYKMSIYVMGEELFEMIGSCYNYLLLEDNPTKIDLDLVLVTLLFAALHVLEHSLNIILSSEIVIYTLFHGFRFFIYWVNSVSGLEDFFKSELNAISKR